MSYKDDFMRTRILIRLFNIFQTKTRIRKLKRLINGTIHIISSKPMISNCNAGIPTESRVTSWIIHSDWFVKYDSYRGSHYLLILEEERNAEKVCRHRKRISCKRNFVILKWLRSLHIFRITCQVSEPWTIEKNEYLV